MRYCCSPCKKTYSFPKKKTWKKKQLLQWFECYVLYGNNYETLSSWSGYSIRKLECAFHTFLEQEPPTLSIPQPKTKEAYLLLDGLWFGKKEVLMLYRQSQEKTIIHASFMKKEYASLICKDLIFIKSQGYLFSGIVSDSGTGIRKAVWHVYPHVPHQLCMAHVHRSLVRALGRKPKDARVQRLKKLADHIWLIESREALRWWEGKLQGWIKENRSFIWERRYDETGRWWFIHKGVRKAVRVMVSAPDTNFAFLTHPLMPRTTNKLEGSISMLSAKHLIHRGLKRNRTQAFIRWFLYFYNRRLIAQRKNKED